MHFNENFEVKLVLWTQSSHLSAMMWLCKCFPHIWAYENRNGNCRNILPCNRTQTTTLDKLFI